MIKRKPVLVEEQERDWAASFMFILKIFSSMILVFKKLLLLTTKTGSNYGSRLNVPRELAGNCGPLNILNFL